MPSVPAPIKTGLSVAGGSLVFFRAPIACGSIIGTAADASAAFELLESLAYYPRGVPMDSKRGFSVIDCRYGHCEFWPDPANLEGHL